MTFVDLELSSRYYTLTYLHSLVQMLTFSSFCRGIALVILLKDYSKPRKKHYILLFLSSTVALRELLFHRIFETSSKPVCHGV
jgi:hypothetical protein